MTTMKKVVIGTLLMIASIASAQKEPKKMDLKPEQIAAVQSKKLTLALDLSDKQQAAVYNVLVKELSLREVNKQSREERAALTSDQKVAMLNERLDARIAQKRSMQSILDKDQYDRWEKMIQKRAIAHKNTKDMHGKRKKRREQRNHN